MRVPSGPFGLTEQGLLFDHFFLFQNFQAGWERLEYIRFDNQSAAFFFVLEKNLLSEASGRVLTPPPNRLERLEWNNILWYPHKQLLLIGYQNRIDSKRSHPA